MTEYLEREAVVKYLLSRKGDFLDDYGKGWSAGIGAASGICGEFPAADVAPVVRGRWERYGRNLGECSNCGEIVATRHNYCPNCGARMEG